VQNPAFQYVNMLYI